MAPTLGCFVAGTLFILLRRPWAREIKKSAAFWFDRTYDEDALAAYIAAMGGLLISFGVLFLVLWLVTDLTA